MSQPILIAGRWRPARASGTFRAENPVSREPLDEFPVSTWEDCDEALRVASEAFHARWVNDWAPEKRHDAGAFDAFLDEYAARIEARKSEIAETAHRETALPISPRLADN